MLTYPPFLSFLLGIAVLFSISIAFTNETELLNNLSGTSEPSAATAASSNANASNELTDALRSPHTTVQTFIQAMTQLEADDNQELREHALSALDLSGIHTLVRSEKGIENARILFDLLKHHISHPLPAEPTDETQWLLPLQNQLGALSLEKQANNRWLFSKETIAALPDIALRLSENTALRATTDLPLYLKIRNLMPDALKDHRFLTLEYWQWLGIATFILIGIIADAIFSFLMRVLVRTLSNHAEKRTYRRLPNDILRPFGLMVMAAIWWLGISLLGLPETIFAILLVAVKFLASISGVWGAYRLVDLVTAWLADRASQTANKLDDALVPLARRSLKVLVTVIGLIFIADILKINITGLIAGLGLGGLAFALAAKDIAQNLFGSVTILMERTFMVGDWIKFKDVEGTVEDIGFRSTKVRTFYNSLITLPNSNFITASVDNYGARRYRRLSTKLGLHYNTAPDKVDAFCEGVREIIRLHPYMRKDYYHVYLNGLSHSALEILVYVFWETPDWSTELRERHRFLLDTMRLAQQLGIEFAPSQTILWQEARQTQTAAHDATLDAARQQARAIVTQSTGLTDKPDPVTIERDPLSK